MDFQDFRAAMDEAATDEKATTTKESRPLPVDKDLGENLLKTCVQCKTTKSVKGFHQKGPERRDSWCKPCRLEKKSKDRKRKINNGRNTKTKIKVTGSSYVGTLDKAASENFGKALGIILGGMNHD